MDDKDDPDKVDKMLIEEREEWRTGIKKTNFVEDDDMEVFIFNTSYDNDLFTDQFDEF